MKWIGDNWELLSLLLAVTIDTANRATKQWRERKTKFGRALSWVLEAANFITFRKPDIKRVKDDG